MWVGGFGGPPDAQPMSVNTAAPTSIVRAGDFIGAMTARRGAAVSGTFVLEGAAA